MFQFFRTKLLFSPSSAFDLPFPPPPKRRNMLHLTYHSVDALPDQDRAAVKRLINYGNAVPGNPIDATKEKLYLFLLSLHQHPDQEYLLPLDVLKYEISQHLFAPILAERDRSPTEISIGIGPFGDIQPGSMIIEWRTEHSAIDTFSLGCLHRNVAGFPSKIVVSRRGPHATLMMEISCDQCVCSKQGLP